MILTQDPDQEFHQPDIDREFHQSDIEQLISNEDQIHLNISEAVFVKRTLSIQPIKNR